MEPQTILPAKPIFRGDKVFVVAYDKKILEEILEKYNFWKLTGKTYSPDIYSPSSEARLKFEMNTGASDQTIAYGNLSIVFPIEADLKQKYDELKSELEHTPRINVMKFA